MKSLKELWRKYAARIDALSQRERIIVFIAAVAVALFVMNAVFIAGPGARINALKSQMQEQQNELQALEPQLRQLEQAAADPDAALRARRDGLARQVAAVNETIKGVQRDLVPAQKMNALLQDMLSHNSRLQLIAMHTLPVTGLSHELTTARPVPEVGGSAPPASQPAAGAKAADDNIFKHGVEITVQGSYADLHDYLLRLEQLPWRMFWSRAQLSTEDYPQLTLKITIYTISLDKAWLEV